MKTINASIWFDKRLAFHDIMLSKEHSNMLYKQKIISYKESLGEIKKMQIAVSQCYFLELITKVANFKNILEVMIVV